MTPASPLIRLATAWLAVAALVGGCGCTRPSPEDDAPSGEASAAPSDLAPVPVAPSRVASELEIHERVAGEQYDIDLDVLIAVEVDLRSGALRLTQRDTGYRLDEAPRKSLPYRLGLRVGDELISLNEALLLDAKSAELAHQQGMAEGRFMLLIKRGRTQRTIEYRLDVGGGAGAGLTALDKKRPDKGGRTKYRAPFDEVVDALTGAVKRLAENDYEVDRELFLLVEKNPRLLSRRIYDSKQHGGGARAASTMGSLLTAMGMKRGDIVQHFAGEPVSSRADLAKAFRTAAKLSSFSVSVYRRHKQPVEIKYRFVKGLLDLRAAGEAVDHWSNRYKPGGRPKRRKPRARSPLDAPRKPSKLDISKWVDRPDGVIYEVQTKALNEILADRRAMLLDIRARPVFLAGKERGLKLTSIRARSPAHVLGFRNGDIVKTVDGRRVFTMRTFVRALLRAPQDLDVVVRLERKNAQLTLRYRRK